MAKIATIIIAFRWSFFTKSILSQDFNYCSKLYNRLVFSMPPCYMRAKTSDNPKANIIHICIRIHPHFLPN